MCRVWIQRSVSEVVVQRCCGWEELVWTWKGEELDEKEEVEEEEETLRCRRSGK